MKGKSPRKSATWRFNKFHTAYGTRFFIWANQKMPISIDYGRSREDPGGYISTSTRLFKR
jgi:hypothetical protein